MSRSPPDAMPPMPPFCTTVGLANGLSVPPVAAEARCAGIAGPAHARRDASRATGADGDGDHLARRDCEPTARIGASTA